MNQIHHYRKYFYKEIVTSINEVKNGAFYRLYGYKYEDSGLSESYSAANTPLLLVVGKNTQKGLIHCIKLNDLPLFGKKNPNETIQIKKIKLLLTKLEEIKKLEGTPDYDMMVIIIEKKIRNILLNK